MARTIRRGVRGEYQEGRGWGRKCLSANCNVCVSGYYKRPARRAERRAGKVDIRPVVEVR